MVNLRDCAFAIFDICVPYCNSQVLFEYNTEAAEHGGKGQSPLDGKAQGLKCLFAVAFHFKLCRLTCW